VVLTPGQQRAVFVVVVIVLAALGYFLVYPSLHHNQSQAAASPSPTGTTASPSAPPPPTATFSPVTVGGSGGSGVDIYSWLPFTQQGLADAAAVTVKFTVAYDTYSYTENASTYINTMSGLITGQLADTLQAAYAAPGNANLRNGEKQVSTGTAQINSLRAFGPTSITFVVNATQHLVTTHGASNGRPQYFVTVTGSGTSWRVNDIEFSNAGNS
jgi:hypothetical protein